MIGAKVVKEMVVKVLVGIAFKLVQVAGASVGKGNDADVVVVVTVRRNVEKGDGVCSAGSMWWSWWKCLTTKSFQDARQDCKALGRSFTKYSVPFQFQFSLRQFFESIFFSFFFIYYN